MQKGMEIQYHNWKVTYILARFREFQFKKLLLVSVNFQEDGAFRAQGLTPWPKASELFLEDLPK